MPLPLQRLLLLLLLLLLQRLCAVLAASDARQEAASAAAQKRTMHVSTPAQFAAAMQQPVPHIIIEEHLDLRGLPALPGPAPLLFNVDPRIMSIQVRARARVAVRPLPQSAPAERSGPLQCACQPWRSRCRPAEWRRAGVACIGACDRSAAWVPLNTSWPGAMQPRPVESRSAGS